MESLDPQKYGDEFVPQDLTEPGSHTAPETDLDDPFITTETGLSFEAKVLKSFF